MLETPTIFCNSDAPVLESTTDTKQGRDSNRKQLWGARLDALGHMVGGEHLQRRAQQALPRAAHVRAGLAQALHPGRLQRRHLCVRSGLVRSARLVAQIPPEGLCRVVY